MNPPMGVSKMDKRRVSQNPLRRVLPNASHHQEGDERQQIKEDRAYIHGHTE